MALQLDFYGATGSRQSIMAAAKPEEVVSYFIDYIESKFQRLPPYFRNLLTRCTIPETLWCNWKSPKQYGGR